ncbi:hypothetical protein ADM96_11355 [Burkholderia sp. ST111]|nr:hypothetical protein ADM96_11355 [Burkholderia sp. ST111]
MGFFSTRTGKCAPSIPYLADLVLPNGRLALDIGPSGGNNDGPLMADWTRKFEARQRTSATESIRICVIQAQALPAGDLYS